MLGQAPGSSSRLNPGSVIAFRKYRGKGRCFPTSLGKLGLVFHSMPETRQLLRKTCSNVADNVQARANAFLALARTEAYCRISSYLQTMANQGYNRLVAIQLALSVPLYADTGE